MYQSAVFVQNCLREACCSRREVDGTVVIICNLYVQVAALAVHDELEVVFSKCWACTFSYEKKQAVFAELVCNLFHTANEFWAKEKHANICKIHTVINFI